MLSIILLSATCHQQEVLLSSAAKRIGSTTKSKELTSTRSKEVIDGLITMFVGNWNWNWKLDMTLFCIALRAGMG
jgi:hypothetical protein